MYACQYKGTVHDQHREEHHLEIKNLHKKLKKIHIVKIMKSCIYKKNSRNIHKNEGLLSKYFQTVSITLNLMYKFQLT